MDTDTPLRSRLKEFSSYLDGRFTEKERKIVEAGPSTTRYELKTERAELEIIREEFRRLFGADV